MTGRAPGRLHGDDLIAEVLRNMEEGLVRIGGKSLVPSIYRIYLSPDDFEPFRNVVPFIAGEIRKALDDRLGKWNRSKRSFAKGILERIGAGEAIAGSTEVVRVANAWTVEIYPDLDEKIQPGEIEVYSDLGEPEKPEYGAGSMTRRIFPKGADPTPPETSEATPEEVQEAFDSAPTIATLAPHPTSEILKGENLRQDDGTKPRAFAYIRYADQEGPKVVEVTKNQIIIGRGGRSYWVDLKLETLPDVSREHCRIRRDSETGRFTIEDLSQFGTAVNGTPVGRNASAELPGRSTISLAGVIDLQWEAS
jgi:hypothetical protein